MVCADRCEAFAFSHRLGKEKAILFSPLFLWRTGLLLAFFFHVPFKRGDCAPLGDTPTPIASALRRSRCLGSALLSLRDLGPRLHVF